MMTWKTSTTTTKTTTKILDLDTDAIEQILRSHLNLGGRISFKWHVGQWASLTIISEETSLIDSENLETEI